MQDQIFTFETLLRRMQLDDGERPFVIWREKDLFGTHAYPVKIDVRIRNRMAGSAARAKSRPIPNGSRTGSRKRTNSMAPTKMARPVTRYF